MDELSKSLFGGKRIFGAFPLSQELAKEQAAARELEKGGTSDGAKKGWETRRGGSPEEPAPSRSMARRLAIQREEPAHHVEGKRLYNEAARHIAEFKRNRDIAEGAERWPRGRQDAKNTSAEAARNALDELVSLAQKHGNKKAEEHFQDARELMEHHAADREVGQSAVNAAPEDAESEMLSGLDALRGREARADESGFA